MKRKKVNWVLDMDLKGVFDNIEKERLMEMVEQRIADPRILRLIRKWLNAGSDRGRRMVGDGKGDPARGGNDSPNAKDNFEFERRLGFRQKSGAD